MPRQVKQDGRSKKTRRPTAQSSETITIGNISGGTGFAIGRRAQVVVNQHTGEDIDQISALFKTLEQIIDTIADESDKKVAENAIETLEEEARKGEQADEKTVKKWMNFLAETAPDAWEVAIDFFINPIRGVSTVFKKIAERAKLEREHKASGP